MPHFNAGFLLQKAFRRAVGEKPASYSESRRNFVRNTAMATGAVIASPLLGNAFTKSNPTIAIVGAGMAGLNAAYQLKKLGLDATIYEASSRVGGRMYTLRNQFGNNITTDIGGEYVDANHEDIIALAEEFDIPFYDLREDDLRSQTFYFGGKYYTSEDLYSAILPFGDKIQRDVMSLPEEINYHNAASFKQLDEISITAYIKQIGITGWLYDFINVVLTREYGMEASEQSAINLLIMFSQPKASNQGYTLFGDDHEILKITGGSQRLTDALYKELRGKTQLKHALTGIKKIGSGYQLSFNAAGATKFMTAQYIVIAIPFSVLRKIKLDVDMPIEKRRCIDELGYGNSGKFILGVQNKPWRNAGYRGYTFTDLSFGCGWDSSLMQSEKEGSFTIFGGGKFMDEICGETNDALTKRMLPQINKVYPGFSNVFNNKTTRFFWGTNSLSKGGYSAFKKGQWSTLAGWEQLPVGNMYFAGEHVSSQFQGYMNGAAQTGREAAEAIYESVMKRKGLEVEA